MSFEAAQHTVIVLYNRSLKFDLCGTTTSVIERAGYCSPHVIAQVRSDNCICYLLNWFFNSLTIETYLVVTFAITVFVDCQWCKSIPIVTDSDNGIFRERSYRYFVLQRLAITRNHVTGESHSSRPKTVYV